MRKETILFFSILLNSVLLLILHLSVQYILSPERFLKNLMFSLAYVLIFSLLYLMTEKRKKINSS
ncbi:MAG: hypothetical protein DRN03_05255 [Thermoplasmata archaeon]|nr:MAG: hypothetical protein DRN03_05255 [Thermoplasmata archaeon]